ncbi:alpha/beta hydrolase [Streptosporangium sp. KLBMP 9127]|nr:alpha/beta hydrolase [Streptosporangium sp. KLBMP 9127]
MRTPGSPARPGTDAPPYRRFLRAGGGATYEGARHPLRRLAVAVLTVALTGTACVAQDGKAPQTPSKPSAVAPDVTRPPTPGLAAYYSQKPAWTDCKDGFQCAKIDVPLDYAKPEGERIQISTIRLPASGDRAGSILINPGGPGGSGIAYGRAARSVLTAGVRARYDVVGFDPRGVGESSPVRCLSTSRLDAYLSLDSTPDSQAEITALEEGSRRFASGCQGQSARLLPHVGTENAARDVDILRAALGDPGLTYLGKSYGTFLGAVYAQLFPDRVRALVLDGAVDPSLSPVELNQTQAEGFEVAMRAFLEDCFTDETCPFQSRDVDSALAELTALLDRTDQEPLRNSSGDGRAVTESWAALGVITPLYDKRSWPALREALTAAFKGDGSTLLLLADLLLDRRRDGTYSNQTEVNMAINCIDNHFPRTVAAYATAAERAAIASPRFGASVMWSSLPCAFWPTDATPPPDRLTAKGAPPILVVGTERDPATPYEWSEALAGELSSGVLLGFDGDGHTAYLTGSGCVDKIVDAYLLELKVPEDGKRCPRIA